MPLTDPTPSLTATLSRRTVLQSLAASVLAVGLGACSGDGGATEPLDLWAAIASAARADDGRLTARRATAELGLDLDGATVRQPSTATRDRLVARVNADFAEGRTVLVAGWLLSRTEVLLAVIVADAT